MCLSAPVETINDDGADILVSASPLVLGFCHCSTDTASKFDDVGVCTIVGFDGAIYLLVSDLVRVLSDFNSRYLERKAGTYKGLSTDHPPRDYLHTVQS